MNTFEGTNPAYQDEESKIREAVGTTGSSSCSRDDVAFLAEAGGQTTNRSTKHFAFALLVVGCCLAGVAAVYFHAAYSGDDGGGELHQSAGGLDIVECTGEYAGGCHYCTKNTDTSINCECNAGYTTEGSDGFQCLVDMCFSVVLDRGNDIDNDDAFGDSVARVGDVDGDGVADLAVGAPSDDDGGSSRGAVYILFMNADNSVRVEQKISYTQGELEGPLDDYDRFGSSVAGVGDVDGDGVPDLVVGAPHDDGPDAPGAVYIVLLERDGFVKFQKKIVSTQDAALRGENYGDKFGQAVAGVGDLDGDGVVDLAVGTSYGVYIFFMNVDVSVKTEQKFWTKFGKAVAAVGDVDGDGVMDLAVGVTSDRDGGQRPVGAAYILFMNVDGSLKREQKLSSTQGGLGDIMDDRDGSFGMSVAGLGDVDGDGVPDLALLGAGGGAWWNKGFSKVGGGAVYTLLLNEDGSVKGGQRINLDDNLDFGYSSVTRVGDTTVGDDGMISLAFGSAERMVVSILQIPPGFFVPVCADGETCVNTADSTYSHECGREVDTCFFSGDLVGKQVILDRGNYMITNNGAFGDSVARVGDVDGDGVADLAVGAPSDDDGGSSRGAVYILFMNADNSVRVEQKISFTQGGLAVAGVGDMDGDGVPDLVVGAPHDDGPDAPGAVYIVLLERDGFVKFQKKIVSSQDTLPAENYYRDNKFGQAVAGVGDLDGDGVVDLAVGTRYGVYIFFMNVDVSVKTEQKISSPLGEHDALWTTFGKAVAAVGDVDGDGVMDLAVGVTSDSDGGQSGPVGAAYILFMNVDGSLKREQKLSSTQGGLGDIMDDRDGSFGMSVAGLGDVDGDGVPDLALGAGGAWWNMGYSKVGGGAVYILLLNEDGSVKGGKRITLASGSIDMSRNDFGYSVARVGDDMNVDDGMIYLAAGYEGESVVAMEVSGCV